MHALELSFTNNVDLTMFVHEPGAEVWLYTDYWPSKPIIHEVGPDSGLIDFAIDKSIFHHKSPNCSKDPHYKVYGKEANIL